MARICTDGILFKESYAFSNQRVFVNEQKELWHYSTVQEMLGMTTLDHNANRCEKGYLTGKSQFRFAFNLPYDLATSFSCPASPVVVKYSITVHIFSINDNTDSHQHEHADSLAASLPTNGKQVPNLLKSRSLKSCRLTKFRFAKNFFPLTKGRSIFIECALEQAVLSSVGKLQAIITVTNRWKQSIKYVHMSILRKIEAVGYFKDDQSITDTKTVLINTTGVGLPSSKHKIAVGETYIFTSSFNVPALPPSMNVPGLLETSYMVNIAVGRAHNYVIASLRVPITIVTNIVDIDPVVPTQRGGLLAFRTN
ncbi:hypothetical protein OSTOST_05763 [Ostertagia ostertagi]